MDLKKTIKDYRFWVLLFFVVRLFGIFNPPLEVAHNWRQTTVTMAARNFLETGSNILFPRIDIAGEKTGITGMEFPLLNYLIYLVSLVFGYAHWYGRLINLVVSSFGLLYFHKLLKKYVTPQLAFNAAFTLLFSVWFTYSRKIMPDTFSMSLVLIGFYYGSNFLDRKSSVTNLGLYFLFVLAGLLSKLPSAYLFALLPLVLMNKKTAAKAKILLLLFTVPIAALVGIYYFKWVPYLTQTYEFSHFFMGKGLREGFMETVSHLDEAFEKFYEEALGYTGFVLFLIALPLLIIKKEKELLFAFMLAFAGFLIIIFKAGFAFYHHSYYIVPFAPIMALLCGYTLTQVKNKKLALVLLAGLAIESILNKNGDFYIKPNNLAILNLERDLDSFSRRSDLIAINSGQVPTPMYFAHRKGWVESNETLLNNEYMKDLQQKGLKYIVVLKKAFGQLVELPYQAVFENADYRIYKVQND